MMKSKIFDRLIIVGSTEEERKRRNYFIHTRVPTLPNCDTEAMYPLACKSFNMSIVVLLNKIKSDFTESVGY